MNQEATIKEYCDALRSQVKMSELSARELMNHSVFHSEQAFLGQHGEMKAQIMLAVRHLEDARLRMGKVIQYSGDGVSIYDKA